ncbi:acyltransferase [Cryobacterium sp. TMT2-10]|uniref:acyltransferase family protein n=1 Tax=Cryobacterium sp. TMT2-10 TaxID=1259244 RepID=UPI00141A7776|nr:acyltransferase [Cryobacterium sp. TMT2-10]
MTLLNATVQRPERINSLDGLRGLAALAVIVSHSMITNPSVEPASIDPSGAPTWVWILAYTPLHLFWAGTEAVIVFFVLSGFVLMLPYVAGRAPHWASYYPKRLVRLYGPVLVAVLFATVCFLLVPRTSSPDMSDYINRHDEMVTPLKDAFLLSGVSTLNSPLWSLQWEVAFSLLLPLYVFFFVKLRRLWVIWVSLAFLVLAAGAALHVAALFYLPMFACGAALAVQKDRVHGLAKRTGIVGRIAFGAASVTFLLSSWLMPWMPGSIMFSVLGAVMLVAVFLFFPIVQLFAGHRFVQWCGSRSFAIYLIHEPVLVSITLLLHSVNPALVLALTLPIAFGLAELMFRFVERPCVHFGNWVGRRVARLTGAPEQPLASEAILRPAAGMRPDSSVG